MKIIFDRQKIITATAPLMCAVSGKSTLTATEGILMEATEDGSCVMTTFDLEKGIDEYISMIHSVFPNIKGGGDKNIRAAYYTIYNVKKEAIDPNKTKYSSDIHKVRNELIKAASKDA